LILFLARDGLYVEQVDARYRYAKAEDAKIQDADVKRNAGQVKLT